MSYIKSTQFFNTGFIREDSNAKRVKQGLQSQFISNLCIECMKETNQTKLSSFNTLYAFDILWNDSFACCFAYWS